MSGRIMIQETFEDQESRRALSMFEVVKSRWRVMHMVCIRKLPIKPCRIQV